MFKGNWYSDPKILSGLPHAVVTCPVSECCHYTRLSICNKQSGSIQVLLKVDIPVGNIKFKLEMISIGDRNCYLSFEIVFLIIGFLVLAFVGTERIVYNYSATLISWGRMLPDPPKKMGLRLIIIHHHHCSIHHKFIACLIDWLFNFGPPLFQIRSYGPDPPWESITFTHSSCCSFLLLKFRLFAPFSAVSFQFNSFPAILG